MMIICNRITNNSKTIFNIIPSRFFEKQPNEICSHDHLSEKVSKGRFPSPRSSKIIVTKEKERRKGEEKEKGEEEV